MLIMYFHTREQLKEYVHSIHDYIRNSGAGYGMSALKLFNVMYSLKILEGKSKELGLSGTYDWKELKKYFTKCKNKEEEFNKYIYSAINELREVVINDNVGDNPLNAFMRDLYDEIDEINDKYSHEELTELRERIGAKMDFIKNGDAKLRNIVFYVYHQIPNGLKYNFLYELFEMIDNLPFIKNDKKDNTEEEFDLRGKIYEYFIGRDKSAISELGAYFTDRHITSVVMNNIDSDTKVKNGIVPKMIDPFGGSGGFTIQFAQYMKDKYKIDWKHKDNYKNIYHYDMSEDVVKIAGVEFYSITEHFPIKDTQFKRTNTFKEEFTELFDFILSNPPYGGDKNKNTPDNERRDEIIKYNDELIKTLIDNMADEFLNIVNDKNKKEFDKNIRKCFNLIYKEFNDIHKCKFYDFDTDTIKNPDLCWQACNKTFEKFCTDNKIDYDDNEYNFKKLYRLVLQNHIFKNKNKLDDEKNKMRKVNYETCSKFIREYGEKVYIEGDKLELKQKIDRLKEELLVETNSLKKSSIEDTLEKLTTEYNKKTDSKFKYNLKKDETGFNDKEACSLILFMKLLNKDGICAGVLKEGVFFDGKYSLLRNFLINNFNVTDMYSVPANAFENTATKTSIIIFRNNGKTKKIRFHDIVPIYQEENLFEFDDDLIFGTDLKERAKRIIDVEIKQQCVATFKQLSEVKISYNKNNVINFDINYSLNFKDYIKQEIVCPDGYELVKLGDILTYEKKSKRNASFASDKGDYNFYTSSDKIKKCDECDYTDDDLKLIFGTGGTGSLFVDNHFSCSSDNFVCKVKNNITAQYIYYYLKNNWNDFIYRMFNGSTLGHINKERLNKCEIPIPKTDKLMKHWVDRLNKPYNNIIKYKEELKQKEDLVQTKIKKMLEENETEDVPLGELCEFKASLGGTSLTNYYCNKKTCNHYNCYGFITGKNLNGSDALTYINKKGYDICNKFTVTSGDILIQEVYNEQSKTSIVPVKWNNYVFKGCFKLYNFKISNNFLNYYLNSNYFKKIAISQSTGSIFKHLSISILTNIKITLPKNRKLIDKLNPLFEEIDMLNEKIPQEEAEYNKVLEQFSKVFTNDDEEETEPADESEDEPEDEPEQQTVEYKEKSYIVEDNIMYSIKKDGSKNKPVGTWNNGKVKKLPKNEAIDV